MPLQRIDELTEPPIVGQRYLVPCVRGMWYDMLAWWPVWGGKHDDQRFLQFPQKHYHLDRRFIREKYVYRAASAPLGEGLMHGRGYPENTVLPAPEWRRRKCQCSQAEFPIHRSMVHPSFRALYTHYAGHQCQRDERGWVCPHKGMRLASMPVGADGNVQCPLHGLLINAATGIVCA